MTEDKSPGVVPAVPVEEEFDPISSVRRRVLRLVEKALDLADRALDGETITKSQSEIVGKLISFAPKVERESGQPVHLHLSVPRPKVEAPKAAQVLTASYAVIPDEKKN